MTTVARRKTPHALSESATVALRTGAPISITQTPQPADRYVGEAVTIAIAATGGIGPLHYAWFRNGAPTGPDAPELVLASPQLGDAGLYTCIVSDDVGSADGGTAGVLSVAKPRCRHDAANPLGL